MAKEKLNIFLVNANLRPNSLFSSGKVTTPTIVRVVKKATAGTILAPKATKEPTRGKATKAGIRVTLPAIAAAIVENNKLDIILSGKIIIESIDESGNVLSVADLYANDVLGGNMIFSCNSRYPMTIIANSPAAVLQINKDLLFKLLSSNPMFLGIFLELISDNALILSNKIKHYINKTIRESIITYLKNEKNRQNSNIIKLTMSKKMLAEKIGFQRTSLSRELQKMRNSGLITYDSQSITILDLDI